MNNQNNNIDFLQWFSIYLGYQNLIENREQSAHNDIEKANQKQAEFLLNKLSEQFEEQNKILNKILEKLGGVNNGNDEKNM